VHRPDTEKWLRRFERAPDARARLVCLPHAGGSASFFFPLAKALAPAVEVLAVQYPGRQDRRHEPPVDSIGGLTSRLLEVLRPYGRLWAVDGIGGAVFGQMGHQLGALAAHLGRRREAVSFLHDAERAYTSVGAVRLAAQVRELLAGLGAPPAPAAPASTGTIRRDGQFWQLTWREHVSAVRDSKGIRDLAVLLSRPHHPVSAIDLVEAGSTAGADLGPILDAQARAAYRKRLVELDAEIAAAEAGADLERARRLRDERTVLGAELAGAIGLGGRPRTASDPVDRARKAVTMRLRAAMRTVAEADPTLARHLRNAIRTGRTCVYEPDTDVVWRT